MPLWSVSGFRYVLYLPLPRALQVPSARTQPPVRVQFTSDSANRSRSVLLLALAMAGMAEPSKQASDRTLTIRRARMDMRRWGTAKPHAGALVRSVGGPLESDTPITGDD